MNLTLLLPAALAALGALLLPLLIHLARRSQMRPTPFAALRRLRRETRPQRRLRLQEWPLLLTRLLLLALLALWLARPALLGGQADTDMVLAVPGVDIEAVRALAGEGVTPRWLAPGLPGLDEAPADDGAGPASLLRQVDMQLPAEVRVTVAVPERLEGLDAQRPVLSRAVDWRVLPGAMPARGAPRGAPPELVVRYGDADAPGLRYLRAAVLAWHGDDPAGEQAFAAAPAARPLGAGASHLAWLVPGPVPGPVLAWVEAGGTALLDAGAQVQLPPAAVAWWRDREGEPVVEGARLGQGRLLRFTRPLTPAQMPGLLEPDFPRRLRAVLDGLPPAPASARAVDHAPMTGAPPFPRPSRDLRPWLALLIGLVFLIERWLATSRRRGTATGASSEVRP